MAGSKTTSWMTVHVAVERVTLHRYREGVRGLLGPDVELGEQVGDAVQVLHQGEPITWPTLAFAFKDDEQTVTIQPVMWAEGGIRCALAPLTVFRGSTVTVQPSLTVSA